MYSETGYIQKSCVFINLHVVPKQNDFLCETKLDARQNGRLSHQSPFTFIVLRKKKDPNKVKAGLQSITSFFF